MCLMTRESTACLEPELCTPDTARHHKEAQPQTTDDTSRATGTKGRSWAASVHRTLSLHCRGALLELSLSKPQQKVFKVTSAGNTEAHVTCRSLSGLLDFVCPRCAWTSCTPLVEERSAGSGSLETKRLLAVDAQRATVQPFTTFRGRAALLTRE